MLNNKKIFYHIVEFFVPADHSVKIQESEKIYKYLDLVIDLKNKTWNLQVTVIPVVVDALGTFIKGLERVLEDLEIGGKIETI